MSREPDSFFRCLRGLGTAASEDRHYPAVTPAGSLRLRPGERLLWRGRTGVAEYRFNDAMTDHDVRWRLGTPADVVVTDQRLAFVSVAATGDAPTAPATLRDRFERVRSAYLKPATRGGAGHRVIPVRRVAAVRRGDAARHGRGASCGWPPRDDEAIAGAIVGQVRWQWPYWLHVVPPRAAAGTGGRRAQHEGRILLVCKAYGVRGLPALVLSGGDLEAPAGVDLVANVIRGAVATFRVAHASALGLRPGEVGAVAARMAGPVFSNPSGGSGQGTNLPGSLLVGFLDHDEYRQTDAPLLASPGGGLSLRHLASA